MRLCFCPDGEEFDQNLEDLIDDNPLEEDENSESGNVSAEGEKEQSDVEEDLDDDDYDLLEENLGQKFERVSSLLSFRNHVLPSPLYRA